MKLQIGFDDQVLGEYRIREGKVEVVAATDAGREDLEKRLEMYARQMVENYGFNEETLTAEAILRWIPEHSAQGRNWTHLVED